VAASKRASLTEAFSWFCCCFLEEEKFGLGRGVEPLRFLPKRVVDVLSR